MVSPLITSKLNEALDRVIHFLHIPLWWPMKPWLLQLDKIQRQKESPLIKKETKLLQYADDTTAVLSDIN